MRFLYDPLSMSLRDGVDEYRLGVVLKNSPTPHMIIRSLSFFWRKSVLNNYPIISKLMVFYHMLTHIFLWHKIPKYAFR